MLVIARGPHHPAVVDGGWDSSDVQVSPSRASYFLPAPSDLSHAIVDSFFGIVIEISAKSFVRSLIQTWSYSSASMSPRLELSSLPRPRRHRRMRARHSQACLVLLTCHFSSLPRGFALYSDSHSRLVLGMVGRQAGKLRWSGTWGSIEI